MGTTVYAGFKAFDVKLSQAQKDELGFSHEDSLLAISSLKYDKRTGPLSCSWCIETVLKTSELPDYELQMSKLLNDGLIQWQRHDQVRAKSFPTSPTFSDNLYWAAQNKLPLSQGSLRDEVGLEVATVPKQMVESLGYQDRATLTLYKAGPRIALPIHDDFDANQLMVDVFKVRLDESIRTNLPISDFFWACSVWKHMEKDTLDWDDAALLQYPGKPTNNFEFRLNTFVNTDPDMNQWARRLSPNKFQFVTLPENTQFHESLYLSKDSKPYHSAIVDLDGLSESDLRDVLDSFYQGDELERILKLDSPSSKFLAAEAYYETHCEAEVLYMNDFKVAAPSMSSLNMG